MSDFTTVTPTIDNANSGSLPGLFNAFMKTMKINLDDCMPATVIGYDRASNRASIQPQMSMVLSDGTIKPRGAIASIPVMTLGGGGFFINFPLVGGSRGWIKSTDRDMSLYLQSMQQQAPNTQRMHSFEDSFFVPDVVGGYTINAEDANNMVISSMDGTIRVALWSDQVKLTAPLVTVSDRLVVGTGASGSFTTPTGQIVTVQDGIIVNIF